MLDALPGRSEVAMTTKKRGQADKANSRLAHEVEGATAGMLTGAVVGAAAGPPGIVAGAVLGAAAGTVAGAALDADARARDARSRELDAVIGVTGGSLGAPNLVHPPAEVGAYSTASSGAGCPQAGPAEGPVQEPDE
jgi:hypothetical protein